MNNSLKIAELRAELIRHRHLTKMAASAIQALVERLRHRLIDDTKSLPGDRMALLDADLVMAEAYKLNSLHSDNE
jgi:hypothetical protein